MNKSDPIDIMNNKFIVKLVNEYFNSIKKCVNCPNCIYIGTIEERLLKYKELKKKYKK